MKSMIKLCNISTFKEIVNMAFKCRSYMYTVSVDCNHETFSPWKVKIQKCSQNI